MAWFRRQKKSSDARSVTISFANPEARASLENPKVSLSDPQALQMLWGAYAMSAAGIEMTAERALGIPAYWAGTQFLAATIAALPLDVFERDGENRKKVSSGDPAASLLSDTVNDDMDTSFDWRKHMMETVFTRGRSLSFIERNLANKPMNLWALNPLDMRVVRESGRKVYLYRDGSRTIRYRPDEIIDIVWMRTLDGFGAIDPIAKHANTLGLCVAAEMYASKFFQNGGVPPLAMQMPASTTGAAAKRGVANIEELVKVAQEEGHLVLPMPEGHRLDQIGFNPENGQMIEARRFQVEECARILGLPPVFLQDLTRGTFSNTEQQDLHLVKHTITQWVNNIEAQLNAKLFGRRSTRFAEFNVDGLLRGDFVTRMKGHAIAVTNAIRTPNEVRRLENLPSEQGEANKLHIQGATVPLGEQGRSQNNPSPSSLLDEGGQQTGAAQ